MDNLAQDLNKNNGTKAIKIPAIALGNLNENSLIPKIKNEKAKIKKYSGP